MPEPPWCLNSMQELTLVVSRCLLGRNVHSGTSAATL